MGSRDHLDHPKLPRAILGDVPHTCRMKAHQIYIYLLFWPGDFEQAGGIFSDSSSDASCLLLYRHGSRSDIDSN
jgi:hypothetical protein